MTNTVVQFSVDDAVRVQASNICKRMGMDLSTYLRMCVAQLVQDNAIPFRTNVTEITEEAEPMNFLEAIQAANRIAEEYGIADMTLDEINAEITAARNEAAG